MVDNNSNSGNESQPIFDQEVSSLLAHAADRELVEMYLATSSQAAVEALVRRHADMVARVIRRAVSNASDAEDAFQATFLIFLKSAKKIRKHGSVAAWLYGVAYRTACRTRSRLHESKTVEVDTTDFASADYRDPLTRISEQFQLELLDRELQRLRSPIKETLIDHHLLGYTASQIANRMDVSVSAVEGRLRRGRAALRHALARRGISFSVAVAMATRYQTTCQAATCSSLEPLLHSDWFSHALANTTHVSVPKSLHSLVHKEITAVTNTLFPKFGLASAIAACSVAAISAPFVFTSGLDTGSRSSMMIGTVSAQEAQTTELNLGSVANTTGAGGGLVRIADGTPIGGAAGGGALDQPAGAPGSGGNIGLGEPAGGLAAPGGVPGTFSEGSSSAASGGSAPGAMPVAPSGAAEGGAGFAGGASMGSAGGMGMSGMMGGSGGGFYGGFGGGMGGGAAGNFQPRKYVSPGNGKPGWLSRGESTLSEIEEGRELTRNRMRKKVAPNFDNTPMRAVLGYLAEQSEIPIATSLLNEDAMGITLDDPVTVKDVGTVSLQRALELVLKSFGGLSYVVEPEGIQIVEKGSNAAEQRRFYDLSYIVSDQNTLSEVQELINSSFSDITVSTVGSMLVIKAEELQHLEIEELLSQLARMPRENL